jgi:hypothetical protein
MNKYNPTIGGLMFKKSIKSSLTLGALLFTSNFAMADLKSDVELIRSLAPQNHDLAQVQTLLLRGESTEEALKFASQNYLLQDVNNDGLKDLVVIFEQNPTLKNWETDQPCEKLDYEKSCDVAHGPRIINFYLGQQDNSLKLVLSKASYILAADEGGVFGDPLVGLSINKKQSISIQFYGGSNWRWGYTDTVQFRKNDFYVIGKDSLYTFTGDGRFNSKSENLLTGLVIEKSAKDGEANVIEKKYKVKVKPLVKFADYVGQGN